MKSIIICYSQTGSTGKVARAIQKGIQELNGQCDIAKIKEVNPGIVHSYDLIGLGSPVWMGGFTPNVRIFVENFPRQKGRHIFSFNTHGVLPELYFPAVVRKLINKGFTVIGTRDWYGDYPNQLAPATYYTARHPDEIDIQEAESFGREMAENSRRIAGGETSLIPPVPEPVLTPQLLVLLDFYQSGHNPHGRLEWNPDKCIYPKCRLCDDYCLMDYNNLSTDPPKYGSTGNGCDMWMGCTFCEMICPTGAISGNWEEMIAGRMEASEKIVDGNLLEKSAMDAVAEGRLRMLVDEKDVRWDQPYIKVYNKHPRFKIPKEERIKKTKG